MRYNAIVVGAGAAFLLPALNSCDAIYDTAQVRKVAWGAALLSQQNTGGYTRQGVRDEVTAELGAILDEVDQGLACVPFKSSTRP
jgi:hypothetical protein